MNSFRSFRFFTAAALLLGSVMFSGCQQLMQGAAEEPYRKAMAEGRMSPSEYQRMRDDIRKETTAMK